MSEQEDEIVRRILEKDEKTKLTQESYHSRYGVVDDIIREALLCKIEEKKKKKK